ncbi:MAG: hypothetical protein ABSG50_10895 [Opitutaceae bacterium]
MASLQAQTFAYWLCVLHNDDPLGTLLSVTVLGWLRFLRLADWAWFFAWAVRHPRDLAAGLSSRRHFAEFWTYLDQHTARQAAQAAPLP